jgi:hypothetical protein
MINRLFERSPINGYFDVRLVLNQQSRPDRLRQFHDEAKKVKIDYEVFQSIPHPRAFTSFNLSVYAMLCYFWETGKDKLLMMEDDCVFSPDFNERAKKSIEQVPDDWELFYFGCNVIDNNIHMHSECVSKVTGAWTTHCVGIRRSLVERVLNEQYSVHEGMMDDYFAKKVQPLGKSYVCRPMIAVQRPGYSDLWGRETDYRELFAKANEKQF